MNKGLNDNQVNTLRAQYGFNEVKKAKPNRLLLFLKKFWGPSSWIIELIVVLSFVLERHLDAAVAFSLLLLNAVIIFVQEQRAEHAVALLQQKLQFNARVLRNGHWQSLKTRELLPGDVVKISQGDFIGADMEVSQGEISVDQSAITGESLDIRKPRGALIYSGSLVTKGECLCTVKTIGAQTFYGKTITLVQTAHRKHHVDDIVAKLVRWLFVILTISVSILLIASFFQESDFSELLLLSLVLLMGSVPVAMPVMYSVCTAFAARELEKEGVLVKRLSAAEDAGTMEVLCVDKTGTFTQGKITVAALIPAPMITENELLRFAAMGSDMSVNDPLDDAILLKAKNEGINTSQWKTEKYVLVSSHTHRSEAYVTDSGVQQVIIKGSVSIITSLAIEDPNVALAEQLVKMQEAQGRRTLALMLKTGTEIKYLGVISFEDPPREESASLVASLHRMGLRVIMLTGDSITIAQSIASRIGLAKMSKVTAQENNLSTLLEQNDGLAEILPETKFRTIAMLQAKDKIVGMTGDGVNDAPSLRKAEVGIAMSNATDIAKAAASVVLTTEGLFGILPLITQGRTVYQRILTWVVSKISGAVLKAGFVVGAYLMTDEFVISAVAMLFIVLITDFAKIALSSDAVTISLKPDTWNIGPLAILATILGVLMIAESLLLLFIGLKIYHIGAASHEMRTYAFDLLLFMTLFSLFSIRERKYFWSSSPGSWLLAMQGIVAFLGLMVAIFGWFGMSPLSFDIIIIVILGSAFSCLVINDLIKVMILSYIETSS
ncbi:MAG: HAD-IC family P-type ATPase [Proteobacteria bacterium]|nr:HAD-IC family P-type ATPase [Pseudomonadota bacterium]